MDIYYTYDTARNNTVLMFSEGPNEYNCECWRDKIVNNDNFYDYCLTLAGSIAIEYDGENDVIIAKQYSEEDNTYTELMTSNDSSPTSQGYDVYESIAGIRPAYLKSAPDKKKKQKLRWYKRAWRGS